MKIAMWSGPRNLSTALMYAFAARGDCAVWDEPFYAAYLRETGMDHPMRDQIIEAHEADPAKIAAACIGKIPQEQSLFYQKHMTTHMIATFDRQFMRSLTNVFLIRHPARVVASYAKKREGPSLTDLGFVQQADLFDQVADWLGETPLVIDSADIREDPRRALIAVCDALHIPFTDKMLKWTAGPKPFDGVWAPHWYGAVHRSTGIDEPEGPLPDLPKAYQSIVDEALPYYEKLAAHKM